MLPLQLARALFYSKNTEIVSILANQAKNSQILQDLTECNERYVKYCDTPSNPESLWCRDLEMLDNNRRHGAVDESERDIAETKLFSAML